MKNYGICVNDEYTFTYWDCDSWYGEELSKEQIISFIDKEIDELSKHIRPSCLLAFSKRLSDPKSGDKAYSNLCGNLEYIDDLSEKALNISAEFQAKFKKAVFEANAQKNAEGENWLMPFHRQFPNDLKVLLEDGDYFAAWFRANLISSDKVLADALLNDVPPKKVIERDACKKLKENLRWIEYHEDGISQSKAEISKQLARLSEYSDLNKNTKDMIEKAKRALAKEGNE